MSLLTFVTSSGKAGKKQIKSLAVSPNKITSFHSLYRPIYELLSSDNYGGMQELNSRLASVDDQLNSRLDHSKLTGSPNPLNTFFNVKFVDLPGNNNVKPFGHMPVKRELMQDGGNLNAADVKGRYEATIHQVSKDLLQHRVDDQHLKNNVNEILHDLQGNWMGLGEVVMLEDAFFTIRKNLTNAGSESTLILQQKYLDNFLTHNSMSGRRIGLKKILVFLAVLHLVLSDNLKPQKVDSPNIKLPSTHISATSRDKSSSRSAGGIIFSILAFGSMIVGLGYYFMNNHDLDSSRRGTGVKAIIRSLFSTGLKLIPLVGLMILLVIVLS